MKEEQCNMDVDPATLASFGIMFYGEEQQENSQMHLLNSMSQTECKINDIGEGYLICNVDYSSVPERSSPRPVSPALSDILYEFSVPDGIVPLETSLSSADQLHKQESNQPSDDSNTEHDHELLEKASSIAISDDEQELLEEASAIAISDDESKSVKVKRGGRRPIPKLEVIPGKWHCKECVRNFMSPSGLTQHMNTRHSTRNKPHRCDICSKRFHWPDELEQHRSRHSAQNKPYECSFAGCTRRFVHRHDRDRHFATSHGDAPFVCKICGRGIGRKDQLEKHYLSHKHKTNYYNYLFK